MTRSMHGALKKSALGVVLVCSMINVCTGAQPEARSEAAFPSEEIARKLAAGFQSSQADRLRRSGSRDGLIAAALISFSPGAATIRSIDDSDLIKRLATDYSTDMLAVYVAAVLCNTQKAPCLHPEYRQQLLKLDPSNAVHWLIVPSGDSLSSQDLQRASESTLADTHFSEMLGIVRRSLEPRLGEVTPVGWRGNKELELMLRRNEIARVPWPNYAQTIALCNVQTALSEMDASSRRNCSRLGKLLFEEHGRNIATKMVGGAMLRRFSKNTPEAAAAFSLRRQYVWISEQLPETKATEEKEQLNEEEISVGGWEAYQRSAERSGVTREPPSDWIPKRPEQLLLPEERGQAPAAGKQ
jgi:hypothetical protein